jgi:hypothetical protein
MRTMRLSRLWALASLSLWIPLSVPSASDRRRVGTAVADEPIAG